MSKNNSVDFKISAEVHTDDYVHQIEFDALPWFKQASDGLILELAECGWGGDLPADEVAIYMGGINEDVKRVMDNVGNNPNEDLSGFECNVDEDSAIEWVEKNRPHLVGKLKK